METIVANNIRAYNTHNSVKRNVLCASR